ncbi:hypothetical protein Sgly_2755 [Syntrophobotulus glycolicus DSM 8271]|uniref:DUF4367 domain-containing protein n=1 Tax=Syntrophobotulus glycolicus (strain DSM 8271 / FlGlyR) TaxID=645991 RepID=F0SXW5_SYNGF|nr:DUF4367 domain-containing protein [Syntrophobotulus glycolicus]ADY57026.1 hypothetical protein Sgly_2755 [Syntrophobotulus glycolicus DSM 8271]
MDEKETAKAEAEEKMLEALYEYAAACHAANILAEYPAEDDADSEFTLPPEFNRKMKKIIACCERKERWDKIRKTIVRSVPKAAIFLLVLLGSFTIVVASVQAFRVKALNIILDIQNQYTSIQTEDENNDRLKQTDTHIPQDWNGYVPNDVPSGFTIDEIEESDLVSTINYKNEKGHTIEFNQYFSGNTDLRIDTEGATVQTIMIHSSNALLSEKQGIVSIVWKEDYLLSLIGEADKAEMIKMAESIKKK